MTILPGAYPPVLTPFRGGEVAHDRLASNVARLNAHPLSGYVVLGSTGEFPLLTEGEKERVWAPLPAPAADGVEEIREILATAGLL